MLSKLRNTVPRTVMIVFGIVLSLGAAVLQLVIAQQRDGSVRWLVYDVSHSTGLANDLAYWTVDFVYIYGTDLIVGGMLIALVAHMVRP